MARREFVITILFILSVTLVFFYKVIFQGLVPFPGDLLVSEYNPWRTYSYLGYIPGTFPSKVQYFDAIRQLYPWKTVAIESIKNGQFALWTPYNFSGAPLLANVQSAVFYPLNIFYFFLPQVWTWTILVMLQPLLATVFMFLFAREIGIGKVGSVFSSIAYGYSLFMTVFLQYNTIGHIMAFLPLALYFTEKLLKSFTHFRAIGFTLVLTLPFLAGHIQVAGFSLAFVIIYILFRTQRIKILLAKLSLIILALGIAATQLFPAFELIRNSARVPQEYTFLVENLLLQPQQLILFLSPDFFGNPVTRSYLLSDSYPGNAVYIGLVPFLLSFFVLAGFRKNLIIRYFTLAALILLLFFVRSPLTEIFYKFEIPLFSTGSPTNAIFLLSFSLSILSGFGIELWLKSQRRMFFVVPAFFALFFALLWIIITITNPQVSVKNFLYSTLLLLIFFFVLGISRFVPKKKTIIAVVLIAITAADLFYFFQKFNPFVPKELVFPNAPVFSFLKERARIDRFWGYGTAAVEANVAAAYKLFSPDGYDPLYPRWYGEFIQASKDGKIKTTFTSQTRSDAVIQGGFGEEDLSANLYRLRVLDLLGVRYVLDRAGSGTTEKTFPTERFKLIYEQDGWRVFENKKALPRTFLTSDYQIFKSKEEFEQIFFSNEFNPSRTILVEETPLTRFNDLNHLSKAKVETREYNLNSSVFQVQTDTDQLLFLSDTYYPGWKAFVDGEETKIYRADYAFRAVVVPKGEHVVRFVYEPASFSLGLKTTIISLIVLGVFTIWVRRKAY